MNSENTFQKGLFFEIMFVKYFFQNQVITTVNENCKFHINPCKQNYANSREIGDF